MLVGTAALAATAFTSQLDRVIDQAHSAEPTRHAPLSDIEHVVFLMMENRSFDHYFGTYRGVRGFGDPRALPGVFEQRGWAPGVGRDPAGRLPPFHLNTKNLASYAACVDDISHDWTPQHEAWNHGAMDRWVSAHLAADAGDIGPLTMGYYEAADIPLYRSLADAFTICDDYYCSVLAGTDPNRVMWLSGSIDPDGRHGGPCVKTLASTRSTHVGRFHWTTMPEQLTDAGVSWKVYQAANDTLLNPLLYFKNFTYPSTELGRNAAGKITYPAHFEADVRADSLPAVSWIFPDFLDSDHPSGPPMRGEALVARVLKTVVDRPSVWEKTAIVVMYDENGGFFDHVPPPTPPAHTPGEFLTTSPLPLDAAGVSGPHRARLPGAVPGPVAVQPRRVRLLGHLRPHLAAEAHRDPVRGRRAEPQRLAPIHRRRPHQRVQLRSPARQHGALAARSPRRRRPPDRDGRVPRHRQRPTR